MDEAISVKTLKSFPSRCHLTGCFSEKRKTVSVCPLLWVFAQDKINVLFTFSHDRGNGCLPFLDNLAYDSFPLSPEIFVSRRQEKDIRICNYLLITVQQYWICDGVAMALSVKINFHMFSKCAKRDALVLPVLCSPQFKINIKLKSVGYTVTFCLWKWWKNWKTGKKHPARHKTKFLYEKIWCSLDLPIDFLNFSQ